MKQSRSCYTCQRHSYNLMNATCGHKICFYCVKSNKNSHKCSECMGQTQIKTKAFLSPSKDVSRQPKQRSTKVKDSDSKNNIDCSPINLHRSRPSLHKSSFGLGDMDQSDFQPLIQPILNCKEHHEPLSMYCKSAKQLICSVCLCNRSKTNGDILPLKSAEEHLRKQNKANKEESKIILGNIQNAQKIINRNLDIFRNCYHSSLQNIQNLFDDIQRQVKTAYQKHKEELLLFFDKKFKECEEITQDLQYLNSILREFRQSSKDSCNFSESIYLFTSFKVIKGTIKSLDLDYIPYTKEVSILDVNKNMLKDYLKDLIKLRLDLPLKFGNNRNKQKSHSNKSVSRSKHEDLDQIHKQSYTGKLGKEHRNSLTKKHQMSLCNNVHGIEINEQQRNLYKMLLKTKFKL